MMAGTSSHATPASAPQTTATTTAARVITGTVTDATGEPLIGATVMIKGTNTGVMTDLDGNFQLSTNLQSPVLVITYVGCTSAEVTYAKDETNRQIMLQDSAEVLDEVVVTALGIKREQKSLSYNVQQLDGSSITENKDANFINSLAGKVAGVNINASSSGVGGISKVVMRGQKSIMQSSNALYVIDGMPMRSSNSGGSTEFGSQGSSEPIADINPDDIESMSVLTGAAAAALYGSEAANGAIVITTKKGQAGKTKVTVNSNMDFNRPMILPEFQSRYGTGVGGKYVSTSDHSWGAPLSSYNNYGYNMADDYIQTGYVSTQSVTFSTGTEKNQTYASVSALNSKGFIPNNGYNRYNFNIRNTSSFLQDKMTLDLNASYIRQEDRNMINQGVYNNPLVGAYLFPRGNDWNDITMYERYDPQRKIYTQYWPVGDAGMTMQNPYWINYRNPRETSKDRYMLGASLSYKILPTLTLSGRIRMDNSNSDYTEKFYATTNNQLTGLSDRGYYGITRYKEKQIFGDFLLSYNDTFADDWSLQANFGGSISDNRYDALYVKGPIADDSTTFAGESVGLANFFAIQNLSTPHLSQMQEGWHEQTQSLYASADLGYRNTYYLTLTGRNDWPSQLAGPNSQNSSFFYPSVGVSVLMSQLLPNLNPEYLSFWKIRGSWASVGTAFNRYLANPRYEWNSSTNSWSILTQYPMYNLKPERTNSWEVGMNFRFLKDFTLDATYYHANTENQTFNPNLPVNKYSKIYIQTGSVRNYGMEWALNFDHTWGNFTWQSNVTYSFNRNKIKTLANNAINPETGETFSADVLDMGGLGSARFLLIEGGSMGDLYSTVDLMRDSNGNIYIDQNGNISTQYIQNKEDYIKLGSVLPKGNLAWTNTFRWKNISLSAMVSARFGGIVYSRTQAILDQYGVSEASAAARDLGYVTVNGGDLVDPEVWYNAISGDTSVPQYYTYSATNVRLQDVTISYNIPRRWLRNVCDIKVSLIGRNLLMIYNKAPFDPESVATTDNYYQGIDYFMMPSQRSMGFNVNITF
jgi:TonB-linked SusC/RagA family outer membrane protein